MMERTAFGGDICGLAWTMIILALSRPGAGQFLTTGFAGDFFSLYRFG